MISVPEFGDGLTWRLDVGARQDSERVNGRLQPMLKPSSID